MKVKISLITIALMMTGCCGTTGLSVSASNLINTLPKNLLEECPPVSEVAHRTDFATTLFANTANHRLCRKNHNELVELINSVKEQSPGD